MWCMCKMYYRLQSLHALMSHIVVLIVLLELDLLDVCRLYLMLFVHGEFAIVRVRNRIIRLCPLHLFVDLIFLMKKYQPGEPLKVD